MIIIPESEDASFGLIQLATARRHYTGPDQVLLVGQFTGTVRHAFDATYHHWLKFGLESYSFIHSSVSSPWTRNSDPLGI